MAPAAASIRSSSAAAAGSKRPPSGSDDPAEQQQLDLDPATIPQGGGDKAAAHKSQQQQLECPRCRSTNTKFCYYNNYSTAQPRHFCRACRRYWTHGGTLRDVPVGGAPRTKRRRLSSSAEPPSSSSPPLAAGAEDASFPADFSTTLFPFLSDGSFLPPPQLDFDQLGVAPSAVPWLPSAAAVPDFYYGTLAPWDDDVGGTLGDGGAWGGGDIVAGLELTWPPPPGN